jgi:hypothetical protein
LTSAFPSVASINLPLKPRLKFGNPHRDLYAPTVNVARLLLHFPEEGRVQ